MVDQEVLGRVEALVEAHDLHVVVKDTEKPWGTGIMLEEDDLERFAPVFFPNLTLPPAGERAKMSPKFLLVAPQQRLSWQYHHRRSEHWHVVEGPLGVAVSDTDEQGETRVMQEGEEIQIAQGERHRLIGLDNWGVIAEIWTHTDPHYPSDEADIVRVQDDYDRPRTE